MPQINITADTANVEAAMNRFTAQLQAVDDRIKKVTATTNIFNDTGEQIGSILKGVTKDGQEFSAVIGRLSDGMGSFQRNANGFALGLKQIQFKEKSRDLDELAQKTNNWEQVLARVQRSLQYFVAYRAFNFISNEITQGIQAAKDFQIQLSLIRTISQDNQQSFEKFGDDVRRVSDKAGIDINKVGKAFYDTVSNQIAKGANTAPFVEQAAELARVTGSELPDAVNLLSSRINAYGLSAKDATILSAEFFRTIDEGRVVAGELANTLGRVDVIAANLGVARQEVNALIAITTQKGFKTSDALTLLTNLLIKLEKPTEATKAFFQELGVSSGEAAVKLYGFNGILEKMVESIKSGKTDVSAFFDEIRGRKQFGVVEQSIDQIKRFTEELKNQGKVVETYNKAIEIRGESPADKLVKELNKVSNIFTIDFGQGVIKATASLLEFTGGANTVAKVADGVTDAVKILAATFVAYRLVTIASTTANVGLITSLKGITIAGATAVRTLAPLLAVAGGYYLGKKFFTSEGQEDFFGKVDVSKITATGEALDRFREKYKRLKETTAGGAFGEYDEQSKKMTESFQKALSLVAGANRANNQLLTDAKEKARLAAEAVKAGFGTYTDTMKKNISEIKKQVTEATTEIEKSQKSILHFSDSLNQLVFNTKFKYANEDFGGDFGQVGGQKAKLLDQQIGNLKDRAYQLFGLGTPEAVQEARKVFDEIARLEQQRFEFQTDYQKKQAEASGATGIFFVDTMPLQEKLNALLAERNALEAKYTKQKQDQITSGTAQEKKENARLDALQQAMKNYENLNPFNDAGSLKSDYKDKNSRFDSGKLSADLKRYENEIRNNFTGSFEERVNLEKLLFEKRVTLQREAAAQERADYLKTTESRILGEQETYQKKIENLKKSAQDEIDKQGNLLNAFGEKPKELAGFANKLIAGGGLSNQEKADIGEYLNNYSNAVRDLAKNKIQRQGLTYFDPQLLDTARAQYDAAVRKLFELNRKGTDLTLDENGRQISPADARTAAKQQFDELMQSFGKLQGNLAEQRVEGKFFDQFLGGPIESLKAQFPELADASKNATKQMNQQFKDLANGGIEDLRKKLAELQSLLGGSKISADLDVGITGEAGFMATGGQVGFFPGQPRGVDRYPIWAAKGEYIVNAQSTAMFKPMLEAINNRRMPRYMAGGGMVGGNTTIGDININVTGATTNNDTGRAIAYRLERELRRRNINLSGNQ